MMQWEMDFLNWINEYCHDWAWLNTILRYITALGDGGFIWFVVGIIFLFIKKYRPMGITLLGGLILIAGFNVFVFKPLVHRLRPIDVVGGENLRAFAELMFSPIITIGSLKLFGMPHGYSFLSGHTLSSTICATVIFSFNKKMGIGAIVLAAFISLTRLYFGVHYPTDVIVGAFVGVAAGIFCVYVYKKINRLIVNKMAIKKQKVTETTAA
jgi:undecaprenyl-diphosphatase